MAESMQLDTQFDKHMVGVARFFERRMKEQARENGDIARFNRLSQSLRRQIIKVSGNSQLLYNYMESYKNYFKAFNPAVASVSGSLAKITPNDEGQSFKEFLFNIYQEAEVIAEVRDNLYYQLSNSLSSSEARQELVELTDLLRSIYGFWERNLEAFFNLGYMLTVVA